MMHTYSVKQNTHAHKLKTNQNLKTHYVPRENSLKIGNKEGKGGEMPTPLGFQTAGLSMLLAFLPLV